MGEDEGMQPAGRARPAGLHKTQLRENVLYRRALNIPAVILLIYPCFSFRHNL